MQSCITSGIPPAEDDDHVTAVLLVRFWPEYTGVCSAPPGEECSKFPPWFCRVSYLKYQVSYLKYHDKTLYYLLGCILLYCTGTVRVETFRVLYSIIQWQTLAHFSRSSRRRLRDRACHSWPKRDFSHMLQRVGIGGVAVVRRD